MAEEDCLPILRPSDVIVLVMGLTGVGKSSFIEKLTGEDAGVGHSLVSGTTGLGCYCFVTANRRVFLVDTPGFDDTRCSDTIIFQEIAFFLGQAYASGAMLGGVIYLHRITDNRMAGSAMRSLSLLKAMCGPEAAKFAMLVTTMWEDLHIGELDYDRACQREAELRNTYTYWGSMVEQKSPMQRWNGTRASALSMLTGLLWKSDNQGPVTLQIQKELIDQHKDLDETSAGRELAKYYGTTWQQLQQKLKSLRASYEDALEAQDTASVRQLKAQKSDLESQLQTAESAEQSLRDDLKSLFTAKTEEYQRLFNQGQREMSDLSERVEELEMELKALHRRVDQDAAAFEAEKQSWEKERAAKTKATELERLDKLQRERRHQYKVARERNEAKKREVELALAKVQKRKVLKRNALPILGVLGGVAAIAGGAVTMQIPIIAAGIALVGTAGMKLDFSRKATTKKKDDKQWDVDDHDAS